MLGVSVPLPILRCSVGVRLVLCWAAYLSRDFALLFSVLYGCDPDDITGAFAPKQKKLELRHVKGKDDKGAP